LDVIAVTDHDTTAGIEEAQRAAQFHGSPVVIPGIELSTFNEDDDVHMLGYFVNVDDAGFQARLVEFRDDRYQRGQRILERLEALGMPLRWDRVLAIAEGGAIGRPHIARALVEAGYVESVRQAFDLYIGNDAPAYVARKRLSPEAAVAYIHEAGGVAVLAHPGLLPDYLTMIERLAAAGLDGVEVCHPSNDQTVRLNVRGAARRFNLIQTGGSDFHGALVKSDITLGMESPPEGAVAALRERAQCYAKPG
jgi:predicted metal-dependent phosphoesterase TrpH